MNYRTLRQILIRAATRAGMAFDANSDPCRPVAGETITRLVCDFPIINGTLVADADHRHALTLSEDDGDIYATHDYDGDTVADMLGRVGMDTDAIEDWFVESIHAGA